MIERCVCVSSNQSHCFSPPAYPLQKKYAIICIHVTHAEEKKNIM